MKLGQRGADGQDALIDSFRCMTSGVIFATLVR
jgi:hypothetical protein